MWYLQEVIIKYRLERSYIVKDNDNQNFEYNSFFLFSRSITK